MDITPIFKACVMTVRLRNKSAPVVNKNRILQKRAKGKDPFSHQINDISLQLTTLKNLLIENRAAYMKFAYHLKNSTQMTDEQRNTIDTESEKIIQICTKYIGQLRSEYTRGRKQKPQVHSHYENCLDLLEDYLKCVENIHLEQKKYRAQHEIETYKLLKLESDRRRIPIRPARKFRNGFNKSSDSNDEDENFDVDSNEKEPLLRRRRTLEPVDNASPDKKISSSQKVALDDDIQKTQLSYENDLEISPEDVQLYESENSQLYQELQGLSEEVEQIGKNVVDIAKLQDIFTEKISIQRYDIERIANTVVGATENVKDANEHIKQAIQRNAGLRVWTLFFLLVMSFTLLFLDWYND